MLSSYSRNGHAPALRRRRNASLRQVIVPDWDAGVKRMARFIKQWPATEIDPKRIPLYPTAMADTAPSCSSPTSWRSHEQAR